MNKIKAYFTRRKRDKRRLFIEETNLMVTELQLDVSRLRESVIYLTRENAQLKEIIRLGRG